MQRRWILSMLCVWLLCGCSNVVPAITPVAAPVTVTPTTTVVALSASETPTSSLTATSTITLTCTRAIPTSTVVMTTVPAPSVTSLPSTSVPSIVPTLTPEPMVERPTASRVEYGTLSLPAYDLKDALYVAQDLTYSRLNWDKLGGVVTRTFDTVILRNEYLELTLIPELGGRIYQCVFLPTGQELFYNTPVLKPTHWGPRDQGWWLAVGGLEFCLPVDEHGYLTAEPWDCDVRVNGDGSVTASMQCLDTMRNMKAVANITLPAGCAAFELDMSVTNVGEATAGCQYWVNGMMAPGGGSVDDSLQVYCPAERVLVHSRGDDRLPAADEWMEWPTYAEVDWAQYSSWENWLGFFAPELQVPAAGVYARTDHLGMVRVFDDQLAGTKMFGFGSDFGDTGQYTDDGSTYFEMWGGLTTDFSCELMLDSGQSVGWHEDWWVVSGISELTAVDGQIAVCALRNGKMLSVEISSPEMADGDLRVCVGDRAVATFPIKVSPDLSYRSEVDLGAFGSGDSVDIEVRLGDQTMELVVW